MKLTKFEKRVLDQAKTEGTFTPTSLGMALGFDQRAASSRVAAALRMLTEAGILSKTVVRHNSVTYSYRPPSPSSPVA